MIRRFALFFGDITPGKEQSFREAVLRELLPTWEAFPGASSVQVAFEDERDEGAPGCPLILALDFETRADLERALASQERLDSRAATQRVLPEYFEGRIFHYITAAENYSVA